MNILKRGLGLAVGLAVALAGNAFAVVDIAVKTDVETLEYTFSGTSTNPDQLLTVTVAKEGVDISSETDGESKAAYFGTAYANASGSYQIPIKFSENMPSGTYYITVTESKTGETTTEAFVYASKASSEAAIEALNAAADARELGQLLDQYQNDLLLDMTDYNALLDTAKADAVLYGIKTSSPFTTLPDMHKKFRQSIATIAVSNTGKAKAVLEKYADALGFQQQPFDSLNPDAQAYAYALLEKTSYSSPEELLSYIEDSMAIATVSKALNFSEIRQIILTDYPAKFTVNLVKYQQVKLKDEVFKNMLGTDYPTLTAISVRVDQEVENQLNREKTPTGGGGGGGGGNSGNGPAITAPTTTPAPPPDEDKVAFDDLGGAAWAEEAIIRLYENGIISKDPNHRFRPGDQITRAEFATLIIKAIGVQDQGGASDFSDVQPADWYYDAVRIASGCGIIKGVADGRFAPEENIKRQDMAVMLTRALEYLNIAPPEKNPPLMFEDASMIDSYAADSVAVMQQAGIINGMGDGRFAPQANATRAEAAKMIDALYTLGGNQ